MMCENHIEHLYTQDGVVVLSYCKYQPGDKKEDGTIATKDDFRTECGESGKKNCRMQYFMLLLAIVVIVCGPFTIFTLAPEETMSFFGFFHR